MKWVLHYLRGTIYVGLVYDRVLALEILLRII
jgi:hypothetical protein